MHPVFLSGTFESPGCIIAPDVRVIKCIKFLITSKTNLLPVSNTQPKIPTGYPVSHPAPTSS